MPFRPKQTATGPKGPGKELIDAVLEMKRGNRGSAAPELPSRLRSPSPSSDKDVRRRILGKHFHPESCRGSIGAYVSWLPGVEFLLVLAPLNLSMQPKMNVHFPNYGQRIRSVGQAFRRK